MADAHYTEPRLAALYDPLDQDRSDLEVYAAMAAEFGARSVLDIGCGTGTLACLLASRGFSVTGLDPALASLDIARAKPFGDRVRWVHGPADALPPLHVDLATMTGNVAQVFITDEEWGAVLAAAHAALRPGGRLVFETRDPARHAWLEWGGRIPISGRWFPASAESRHGETSPRSAASSSRSGLLTSSMPTARC